MDKRSSSLRELVHLLNSIRIGFLLLLLLVSNIDQMYMCIITARAIWLPESEFIGMIWPSDFLLTWFCAEKSSESYRWLQRQAVCSHQTFKTLKDHGGNMIWNGILFLFCVKQLFLFRWKALLGFYDRVRSSPASIKTASAFWSSHWANSSSAPDTVSTCR